MDENIKKLPFVSVIIPCRNEDAFIDDCIKSILSQTYSKNNFEIIAVDGMSLDKTKEIIEKYKEVKVIDNPKKIFSAGCNAGIVASKGDLVIIIGSHAIYPKNYIERCVYYSLKFDADNVGGNVIPVENKRTFFSESIILSFGGWFGKTNNKKVGDLLPYSVDTVFGGCYKRNVFEKYGYFNENLKRTADLEFNLRLAKFGGKIILAPEIVVKYFPKTSILEFFIHNIDDGVWNILPLKFTGKPLKFRHYLPLIFFLTLPISIFIYIPACVYFSFKIAIREKNIKFLFLMPIVFLSKHLSHGIGSLMGVFKLII